jgi:hypothetical protein
MKMVAEYKAPKKRSDDPEQLPEPVERKQILSAERVSLSCSLINMHLIVEACLLTFDTYSGS